MGSSMTFESLPWRYAACRCWLRAAAEAPAICTQRFRFIGRFRLDALVAGYVPGAVAGYVPGAVLNGRGVMDVRRKAQTLVNLPPVE